MSETRRVLLLVPTMTAVSVVVGAGSIGMLYQAVFREEEARLGLGIISKVDLAEIRALFIKAGLTSGLIGIVAVLIGTPLFLRTTDPLIKSLQSNVQALQGALDKVKLLSGLLPICASCKKIREDKGYWNNLEAYIAQHSEAELRHSICPEGVKRLCPGYGPKEEESGGGSK